MGSTAMTTEQLALVVRFPILPALSSYVVHEASAHGHEISFRKGALTAIIGNSQPELYLWSFCG